MTARAVSATLLATNMTDRKFVLFDFDGVIADSFALASALAQRKCQRNTAEHYRSAFEGNIYDDLKKYMMPGEPSAHDSACDHDLDWWPEYEKGFAHIGAFGGIIPAIEDVAKNYALIIVTSCRAAIVTPFLERAGLAQHFLDILDVDVHTHKTKKIEMVFEKYHTSAVDCVFITDTLGDIREAAHHQMGSIAVSWGFHGHDRLEQGNPFRIVDKPSELPAAINDYFNTSQFSRNES